MDKHYWQRYLLQTELDPTLLKEFMYDNNPLDNFLSLIDRRNHRREDNLRSAKHLEKTDIVSKVLNGLGFASAVDKGKIDKETLLRNFQANIADDPDCKNRKRINELFDLNKNSSIDRDMNPQRILLWANTLLKPYGIAVKGEHYSYWLVDKLDLKAVIKRKNEAGKYYVDGEDLLGQTRGHADLFLDESTGEVLSKKPTKVYDTSKLDIICIEAPDELCCLNGKCPRCR